MLEQPTDPTPEQESETYAGQWCYFQAECRNCLHRQVSVAPARFGLEKLPVECGDCHELTAYPVEEPTLCP